MAAGGLPDGRAHGRPHRVASGLAAALQPARLRGFAYAAERGLGQRYTEQIFRAFFVQQRDIGRPEVLTDVAVQLGLDADDFRAALDSGRYAQAHQRALRRAQELEITVVPTMLVDGRRLEGMPSAQALHQLLNSVVALR
ncbi:MAG TPA: DsbA family protein [Pseudonocardiaceae bacterium]